MTLFNKLKWVLGIALIFLLILTTNLIDRQNFMIVRNSIETIYADRLVAQNIVYNLSRQIGLKEMTYNQVEGNGLAGDLNKINTKIENQIALFADTKLTPTEEIVFGRLKSSLQTLQQQESALLAGQKTVQDLVAPLDRIHEELDELSAIQIQEGKRELLESQKAIGSADLFTQLEIAILIVIAIAVQVIILYTPKLDPEA